MYYGGNANYTTPNSQQQQPGGLFRRQTPGMAGAAMTFAGMPPTPINYDQESVSTESIELRPVPAGGHQQQPGRFPNDNNGDVDADYSDGDTSSTDENSFKSPAAMKASKNFYDNETMTTKSDTSSHNIHFRIDDGDGDRSLSGETDEADDNLMVEEDL